MSRLRQCSCYFLVFSIAPLPCVSHLSLVCLSLSVCVCVWVCLCVSPLPPCSPESHTCQQSTHQLPVIYPGFTSTHRQFIVPVSVVPTLGLLSCLSRLLLFCLTLPAPCAPGNLPFCLPAHLSACPPDPLPATNSLLTSSFSLPPLPVKLPSPYPDLPCSLFHLNKTINCPLSPGLCSALGSALKTKPLDRMNRPTWTQRP